jgi:DDE superfamily endonuclease
MIARYTLSPSSPAPAARRYAALGLDRSARSIKQAEETDETSRLTSDPSCKDEMRVGRKNKLTYRWAKKGSRPRALRDQRTQSTYLFGAVCPERGVGAALVLPTCNTEAMQLHLNEIATKVAPEAHAIVLLDQAGWHGSNTLEVPADISLLLLGADFETIEAITRVPRSEFRRSERPAREAHQA